MISMGWDLGGAHVKCVVVDEEGWIKEVFIEPCPLWTGIQALEPILKALINTHPNARHGLTMSGEMVDAFQDRAEGVHAILDCFMTHAGGQPVRVFREDSRFIAVNLAKTEPERVASANWLAPAAWIGRFLSDALFFDVGSTTTDILRIANGRPAPRAIGDHLRLISKELVYTGVVRTPLMALGAEIQMGPHTVGVMAELFATTADIYRILGVLPKNADHHATADGGPKTREASMARLSRMVGLDAHSSDEATWVALAQEFSELQKARIEDALFREPEAGILPWMTSGVGHFLIEEIARKNRVKTTSIAEFFRASTPGLQDQAADCAPASAVALMIADLSTQESTSR